MKDAKMINYLSYLIKIVIVPLSSLSFLCCFGIIILFLTRKRLHTFVGELLFHMAISELFNCIAKMLSLYKLYWKNSAKKGLSDQYSTWCVVQRLLGNYSDFSTFLLIILISYTMHDIMLKMQKTVKRHVNKFRICVYLAPAIISSM